MIKITTRTGCPLFSKGTDTRLSLANPYLYLQKSTLNVRVPTCLCYQSLVPILLWTSCSFSYLPSSNPNIMPSTSTAQLRRLPTYLVSSPGLSLSLLQLTSPYGTNPLQSFQAGTCCDKLMCWCPLLVTVPSRQSLSTIFMTSGLLRTKVWCVQCINQLPF